MDIDVQPAEARAEAKVEAKEEMYQRLPIPEKFSFHKEGEAMLKRFLHLYDASAESTTSALYKQVGAPTVPLAVI
jgi:glutaredoxin-related protein